MTGVYCHQKPLVEFGRGNCVELGDLLLMYVQKKNTGETKINALLLQAKMSAEEIAVADNKKQLELYTRWPAFSYKRAGVMNGKVRNVYPKAVNPGARYLLIDSGFCPFRYYRCDAPMGLCVPDNKLVFERGLECDLYDFFQFDCGKSIEAYSEIDGKDEWSNLIWDLFHATKDAFYYRRNLHDEKQPRSIVYHCCGEPQELGKEFEETPYYEGLHRENREMEYGMADELGGPSVILIESVEK